MKLIGMLDSPFVRRAAISLECLGIPFEHQAVSVFKTFADFQKINPVVKAPSLVLDDGTVLMDSNLIIQYAEAITTKSLMPTNAQESVKSFRVLGLALAACEKAVQIIYEKNLRPAEMQFEPWLKRVQGQLLAATNALEIEFESAPDCLNSTTLTQAALTAAVAWQFIQSMVPEIVLKAQHPLLEKHSTSLEACAEFIKYPPIGPGVIASN